MIPHFPTQLHLPVGLFAALLVLVHPLVAVLFTLIFLVYEVVEDYRLRDRGYRDVLWFAYGYGVGAVSLGVMKWFDWDLFRLG